MEFSNKTINGRWKSLIVFIVLMLLTAQALSPLYGQNCDKYNVPKQEKNDLHAAAEDYIQVILSQLNIEINTTAFNEEFQNAASCFVDKYGLENGNDEDNVLILLIFSSRTIDIGTRYKQARDLAGNSLDLAEITLKKEELHDYMKWIGSQSYAQHYKEIAVLEMSALDWYWLLPFLTYREKSELRDILMEEFNTSHSKEYIQQEQDYLRLLLEKDQHNEPSTFLEITMITEFDSIVKTADLSFTFAVAPRNEIKSVNVFVNGAAYGIAETKNHAFESKIKLRKGRNEIVISCFSKSGESIRDTFVVECKPDNYMDRKDRAILFAIDDYSKVGGRVDDNNMNLEKPIKDAERFAKILIDYGFEPIIVPNPTREEIEKMFTYLLDSITYGPYDQLLIFYAGHGIRDVRNNGYIVPSDGNITNLFKNVSFSWLKEQMNQIPCEHILFICDACHSGSFNVSSLGTRAPKKTNNNQAAVMQHRSRLFLGSCMAEDETPDNSPFLDLLLKTITSDKTVNYYSIYGTITNSKDSKIKQCSKGSFGSHDDGNFFFNKR